MDMKLYKKIVSQGDTVQGKFYTPVYIKTYPSAKGDAAIMNLYGYIELQEEAPNGNEDE